MARIVVPDRETGGWVINGEQIAHISTRFGAPGQNRSSPRIRWSENTVWRLDSGKYAVLRGSYSMIYHTEPTACRTFGGAFSGQPATPRDLPRDADGVIIAEPCWVCAPPFPDELAPGDKIRYEVPRQQLDQCDTPEDVVSVLTSYRKHQGSRATGVSEPVRALIAACREADPDFAMAEMPMQEIS